MTDYCIWLVHLAQFLETQVHPFSKCKEKTLLIIYASHTIVSHSHTRTTTFKTNLMTFSLQLVGWTFSTSHCGKCRRHSQCVVPKGGDCRLLTDLHVCITWIFIVKRQVVGNPVRKLWDNFLPCSHITQVPSVDVTLRTKCDISL